MARQTIAQCTPSLGTVSIWWSRCVQCILQPNNAGRSIFYLRDKVGGEIAEVRNALVKQVLSYSDRVTPISHILWIDDDVLVFPGCLRSLLARDTDIASGVYFTKLEDHLSSPLVYSERGSGSDIFRPNDCYRVWGHGMGLTLVRTDVYRVMQPYAQLDKYNRPQWYKTSSDDDPVEEVDGVVGTGYTEDLYFLDSANKFGYKPVVDCTKHAFGFHYDAVKDTGYPSVQWNQWVKGEPIIWDTPEGKVIWS